MKKQIISLILCIGMILTLVPAFATTTETAPTVCNVLLEEDFEDNATSLTVYDNVLSTAEEPVRDASGITSSSGTAYGQGEKVLHLQNNDKNVSRIAFGVTTGELQKGLDDYTVEVNFDWNPSTTKYSNIIRILSNPTAAAAWNATNMSNTVSLYLVENGNTQTLTVYNRKGSGSDANKELDAENLVTRIGAHVIDPDHVYRTKVVITANNTTDTGATISVYLDDVLLIEFDNPWGGNTYKDKYLCGLQFQNSGLTDRGTIDNIKVLEYGTGVTGDTAYINDDGLVSAIREWEYNLSSYEEAEQIKLSSALDEAKAAFEAENRTQATIDAAVTKLNDWQNQTEESEWSAEVSGIDGRKVTIKANEAITDGKIILANYSDNYVVNATLPEFTELAADQTMDITVPETWTGEVRVFFWDTEYNALMECEVFNVD